MVRGIGGAGARISVRASASTCRRRWAWIRTQVTHNPLLVRLPDKESAGKHVKGFVTHPDIAPTLMGRLELDQPPRATGENFWPLVSGETKTVHEHLVQCYGWIGAVRTPEWNYSQVVNQERYGREYKPQLYNLHPPQKLPQQRRTMVQRVRRHPEHLPGAVLHPPHPPPDHFPSRLVVVGAQRGNRE